MKKEEIAIRLSALRTAMCEQGLDAVVLADQDPHGSEYVPDHWKRREWISGFNGSAGTAVVTRHEAALWTDSRYFLQAAEQLEGTEFVLMKEALPDTPTRAEWLAAVLPEGGTAGIDGGVHGTDKVESLAQALAPYGLTLRTDFRFDGLWSDCPPLPDSIAVPQPLSLAGKTTAEKLRDIRLALDKAGTEGIFVPTLDDIAWTLNLRANDIHCNPVKVGYLLVTRSDATFFVRPDRLSEAVQQALQAAGVAVSPYEKAGEALSAYPHASLWFDPAHTPYALRRCLPDGVRLLCDPYTPVARMKAIKNEAETEGFRQAMKRDGVAMTHFLKWLEEAVPAGNETGLSVSDRLYGFRAEQEMFRDISFDTIAGYKEHGAIVHYEATPETDKPLRPEGLLLLDSGAQYTDGTTDITRTIALGPLTDEERSDYTTVLKAHIGLARAKFPQGTCGTQLDALAHVELWRKGLNYLHGTGHGVGSYLNVHEGVHQIRASYKPAPLEPGMTVTNEPGVYKEGRHGIRIENTMIVAPYTETEFGKFYQLTELTLCPIDTTPIVKEMLTDEETAWLDDYHRRVYDTLEPLLDEEHRTWLRAKTRPLNEQNA